MTMLKIERVRWSEHWRELTEIRRRVFVEEQRVPVELELDEDDFTARHWLARYGSEVVGTVRLLADGHVGRMAVAADYRGRGIGRALLHAVIDDAIQQQLPKLELAAQTHAIDFYRKEGFQPIGDSFMDAGIAHQSMTRTLRGTQRLGEDGRKFAVESLPDSALALASLSRRQLWVFCHSLEPEVYAQPRLIDIVSTLARKHRDSEIRLLICDDRPLRESRHPLVELSQRLSSSIHIRVSNPKQHGELSEYFLLADNEATLVHSMRRGGRAWGCFHSRPTASAYREQFDRLWQHAKPSPWLRPLV